MSYIEMTIDFSQNANFQPEIDSLIERYNCIGSTDFNLNEAEVDRILGERAYSGGDVPLEVLEEVEALCSLEKKKFFFENLDKDLLLELSKISDIKVEVNELEDEDWNLTWRKSYAPIEVSNKILVTPSWIEPTDHYETIVKIYPGMGFGTGTHETTFLCLKLFSEIMDRGRTFKSCLDFGCGSGILGLAFLLSSGRECDLVDIDEGALINTRQNLELNNFVEDENIRVLTSHERAKIKNEYNLVFANILQNVLFLEKGFLTSSLSGNGLLILSGLLRSQVADTIAYFETASDIEHLKTIYKGDWAAILIRKK